MSGAPLIRAADARDVGAILALMRELADFEKLAHLFVATDADLADALFGERPAAEALVAERDGAIVAYALFFHNYSTFLGRRGLYLEDLYVQPSQRGTAQKNDPGAAFPAQGYAAHYCSIPTQTNPKLAACSMILSGLRVFDIRDVAHPKEVAYFNKPAIPGSQLPTVPLVEGGYAMSQPAWDTARKSIWYTDANSGFYVVRLTNAAAKLF